MIEFQLKAVPVSIRIICNRGKACVSFWPDSNRIKGLAVYHHIAGIIFLGNSIFQHIIPVILVHKNINIHNLICVKQLAFVFHCDRIVSIDFLKLIRKKRSHKTQNHCRSHDYRCNPCYIFICNHVLFPPVRTYIHRYSLPELHFPHLLFHSDGLQMQFPRLSCGSLL